MTDTRWLSDDQQRAWRAYLLGTAWLMERLERDLRSVGLSMAEYEILVRLSEAPKRSIQMSELATSVLHSASRLTHAITRMEQAGLVTRHANPTDRRSKLVRLTSCGHARLVALAPMHVAGVRESFVDLVSDEDFEAIGRVFTAIVEAHQPIDQETEPNQVR